MSRIRRLLLCAAALMSAVSALGAEETSTDVIVVLPKNLTLAKAHVLIYRVPEQEGDWPTIQADVKRELEREVKASLPDGEYVAEIGAAEENVLTLLRSKPFRTPETKKVTFQIERHVCSAAIQGKDARLLQVALRRYGNGELRWSAESSTPPVLLITSPGLPYVASCVALRNQTYLAVWTPKEVFKKTKVQFTDAEAKHHLSFKVRENTPPLEGSQVILRLPDSKITIDGATKAEYVSNRRQIYCDYQLATKAGERLYYSGGYCEIEERSTFEIGGPMTPHLFAAFIWAENNGAWSPGEVYTRLELLDPGDCVFDIRRSQMPYQEEKFVVGENDKLLPLEANKPGWKGFKPETILYKIQYVYGGKVVKAECHGEYYTRVLSEHFSIATPPAWMFKARHFLSCLEAIRELTRKNTGRPGPESWRVDWRSNGGGAQAHVGNPAGGGKGLWMSFPFWTFDSFWDPFDEPWFGGNHDPYVCHEMLHTFGYHHGDELSQLEWRGEAQFRSLRWRAVDTGDWPIWQNSPKAIEEVKP